MTILDKIEVKIVQFMTLSMYILLSRKWFAWLLKLPVFVLLVCGWIITRPYEWPYTWATTRHVRRCISRKGNLVARESMY
jgi:hypothetical protein